MFLCICIIICRKSNSSICSHCSPPPDVLVCQYCSLNLNAFDFEEIVHHSKSCTSMCRTNHDYNFMCLVCNYHTHGRQRMMRHIRSHTGAKPFMCTYCDHRSSRKDHLMQHIRIKHLS
uniref:RE1-silencing transcription factor n=2 Tax=Cacopsylla melanoneura TaxID=428564 RepID=A0A8D8T5Z7_9HEMI